jgi:membrane protein YqaA with SNARE-associated domain
MISLYERLSTHAKSRWSILISFLWGFAEATAFFIVPDVYMGFVALFNWRKGLSAASFALLGAMLGGSLMYFLAMNNPTGINAFLTHIPLIDADLVNNVANPTRTSGLIAVLTGPFRGTPYKIYAAQAGEQSLPFLGFVLMTIPARLQRFFPLVLILGGTGKWFESFCKRNTVLVISGYALMWVLIYSFFIYRFTSR